MRRFWRWSGGALALAGALTLGFVAYEVWGTNVTQQADQRRLREDARDLLAASNPPSEHDSAAPAVPAPTPAIGDAIGVLSIPDLGVEQALVEGAGLGELRTGPGHYPHSPLPGHAGNVSIAGHRTTYGAPFNRIDELIAGDRVMIQTVEGRFIYRIVGSRVVAPDDVSVVNPTDDNRLTLTTCNPKGSARERLIVYGLLVGDPIRSVGAVASQPPTVLATEDPSGG